MSSTFDDYHRLLAKADVGFRQRGPSIGSGPGEPWNGIVEETPQLWVTWIVDHARCHGKSLPLGIEVDGIRVPIEQVRLTYGVRPYFRCPGCRRRVEVLYFLARQFGCRRCCRLGYRSQKHRPGSIWGTIDRVFARRDLDRTWSDPRVLNRLVTELRRHLMDEIDAMLDRVEVSNDGARSGE